jgi:hypothetical protein
MCCLGFNEPETVIPSQAVVPHFGFGCGMRFKCTVSFVAGSYAPSGGELLPRELVTRGLPSLRRCDVVCVNRVTRPPLSPTIRFVAVNIHYVQRKPKEKPHGQQEDLNCFSNHCSQ